MRQTSYTSTIMTDLQQGIDTLFYFIKLKLLHIQRYVGGFQIIIGNDDKRLEIFRVHTITGNNDRMKNIVPDIDSSFWTVMLDICTYISMFSYTYSDYSAIYPRIILKTILSAVSF